MEVVDVIDDIPSIEALLIAHDEKKKEIEAREEVFGSVIAQGEEMIESGHHSSEEVRFCILLVHPTIPYSGVASSIIGGGVIFIYSCSALLISFEIDCFYGVWMRIYEYLPPNYRVWLRQWYHVMSYFTIDAVFFVLRQPVFSIITQQS